MQASPHSCVLEIEGLTFGFPGIALFHRLSLQVPAGVCMVHGDESSGKTTLLRLMSGDLQALGGNLVLRDISMQAHPDAYRTQVFRTEPRSDALDGISARAWFATLTSRYPSFEPDTALRLASGFSLDPHIDKPMYMLSAGSKRKVWLSAAFAAGTALTLIDEPFAALDMASIRVLHTLLQEAATHTDRAWVLADHVPLDSLGLPTLLHLTEPPRTQRGESSN